MSRDTSKRLVCQAHPAKPEIQVNITGFRYYQRGQLIGFAEGILNGKVGFRNVSYFIPKDPAKKSFCKWPCVKQDTPNGPQYLPEFWWTDNQTNYRILAHIARATEEYLLTNRPHAEARNEEKPAEWEAPL